VIRQKNAEYAIAVLTLGAMYRTPVALVERESRTKTEMEDTLPSNINIQAVTAGTAVDESRHPHPGIEMEPDAARITPKKLSALTDRSEDTGRRWLDRFHSEEILTGSPYQREYMLNEELFSVMGEEERMLPWEEVLAVAEDIVDRFSRA
jgi:hypothetical protein